MIVRPGVRAALALVGVTVVAASLTGCSRAALASQQAPVAVTTATPAPTASAAATAGSSAGSDSSLQSVQDDLNSANSATTNAGGDVVDADRAAATTDSP